MHEDNTQRTPTLLILRPFKKLGRKQTFLEEKKFFEFFENGPATKICEEIEMARKLQNTHLTNKDTGWRNGEGERKREKEREMKRKYNVEHLENKDNAF